jgi:AcrR family transcriptional regulator
MRVRLIEAALHVFAEKSADAAVIDDVIKAAGVSRGTFYNYFRTNEELMAAVLHAVGDEILGLIEAAIAAHEDPAERLAHGLPRAAARRFVGMPIEAVEVPPESLLGRTQPRRRRAPAAA